MPAPGNETTFGSKTLALHLLRGAVGITALWGAFQLYETHPLAAIGLGLTTLVAFRSCPTCWTMGLIETTVATFRKRERGGPTV